MLFPALTTCARYPCPRTVYFIYVSVLCVLLTPTTSTQQNPLDHSTGFITGVPSCHLHSPLHGTAGVRVTTCDSVPDTFLLEILQRLPIALRIKTKSFINLSSYITCRVPPVSSDTVPPSAMVWVPSLGLLSEPQTCHVPFRLMSLCLCLYCSHHHNTDLCLVNTFRPCLKQPHPQGSLPLPETWQVPVTHSPAMLTGCNYKLN